MFFMDALSRFVIGVLVSVVCCVLWAMTLLSLPAILTGGGFLTPDLPFTRSAFYGLTAGIGHGILMAVFFTKIHQRSRLFLLALSLQRSCSYADS